MPSLTGLDVLHLQCHLAFDAISMARRDARVTAVDFSPVAVEKARELAAECGVEVEVVEGDAMRLPKSLAGRFDVAYATLGIFGWIYDVEGWMRSAASCLRPGGKLVIVDFHPAANLFRSLDPVQLWGAYHFSGPQIDDEGGSYAAPTEAVAERRKAKFSYNLAEIVTAAAGAGFRVDFLAEHEDSGTARISRLQSQEPDGRWRTRLDGVALPVLFTLIATRAHPDHPAVGEPLDGPR